MAPGAESTTNQISNARSEVISQQSTTSSRSSTLADSPAQSDIEIPEVVPIRRTVRRRRDEKRSQKEPGVWKKILWVKQSYPDNYTDPPTFLSHLQWNPRVVQYDFWPLVADSTVIVQHVCSVVIFICCFVGIYQERVSPLSVVGWGSTCTFICWLFWDAWMGIEEQARTTAKKQRLTEALERNSQESESTASSIHDDRRNNGLGLSVPTANSSQYSSRMPSPNPSMLSLGIPGNPPDTSGQIAVQPSEDTSPFFSPRWQSRLSTAKSAVLIYSALLALSPILKSLTKSTTSDSIWAMSTWLLLINLFFYDYGGGSSNEGPSDPGQGAALAAAGGVKYQSSLSTNAALMASTVLASRLTSTEHVFSLTLFSIEVFGLFPVFRRYLRQQSWQLHLILTILLVTSAGAGIGLVMTDSGPDRSLLKHWKYALAGTLLWSLGNILAMGACSWWLISLQKYKNVVIGPWDAAKPIVRTAVGFE